MDVIIVKSHTGRDIRARILHPGDSYGRNGCLIWGEEAGRGITDPDVRRRFQEQFGQKLGIEFDDLTDGVANFTGGRYYLSDILLHDRTQGLCLEGSTREWDLDAAEVNKVQDWAMAAV